MVVHKVLNNQQAKEANKTARQCFECEGIFEFLTTYASYFIESGLTEKRMDDQWFTRAFKRRLI